LRVFEIDDEAKTPLGLHNRCCEEDKKVQEELLKQFDDGKTVIVKVLSACGIEKIVACKVQEDK